MSDDLIKRSDAIKVVRHASMEFVDADTRQKLIEALLSADRPQGHYIKGENGEWYCSNCRRIDDKYSVARFCWWCGARTKGADDD